MYLFILINIFLYITNGECKNANTKNLPFVSLIIRSPTVSLKIVQKEMYTKRSVNELPGSGQ